MKLLVDELWPPEVARQLRARGHDAVAVQERPELVGKEDAEVFAAARAEGRAVLTEDAAGFRTLAAQLLHRGDSHSGLVLTSNKRFPRGKPKTLGRVIAALDELLSAIDDSESDLKDREVWL